MVEISYSSGNPGKTKPPVSRNSQPSLAIFYIIFFLFILLELNVLLSMDMVLQNLIQSIIVLVSMPILWIFSFELRRSWLWAVIEESKMDPTELEDKRYVNMYICCCANRKFILGNLTFKSLSFKLIFWLNWKKRQLYLFVWINTCYNKK